MNFNFITEDDLANFSDICLTRKRKNLLEVDLDEIKKNTIICLTGYDIIIEKFFEEALIHIKNPIILVTIETDILNIKKEYLDDNKIIHWFTWNKPFIHPKLSSIPIGINKDRHLKNLSYFIENNNIFNKKKFILLNCNTDTNDCRNNLLKLAENEWKDFVDIVPYDGYEKIIKNISFTDGYINIPVTKIETYKLMNDYKFIICPEGTGLDTHRLWEALYLNCIPIVIDTTISDLYNDFPVVVIKTWDCINYDFLKKKYDEINKKKMNKEYNLDKLDINFWKKEIVKLKID